MQFRKGDRVRYNEPGLRWLMGYAEFCLLEAKEPSLAATLALVCLCFDIGTVEDVDEGTSSMTIRWDSKQVKKECWFNWFRKAEPEEASNWCFHGADHSGANLYNDGLGNDVTPLHYNADAPRAD